MRNELNDITVRYMLLNNIYLLGIEHYKSNCKRDLESAQFYTNSLDDYERDD